nr:SGNH/GDSL hydrolase family protein [Candidatus Sigynarchaeum springense]
MEYSIEQLKPFVFGLPWFGVEDYKLQRFPTSSLPRLPEPVRHLATHPAGGVIRFKARAKLIALEIDRPKEVLMAGFSQVGQYGIDIYRDGQWTAVLPTRDGYQHIWHQADESLEHEYALYLPTYAPLDLRTIILEADYPGVPEDGPAALPPAPYKARGRVVVYGSSITQGAFASRPGLAYPARLGRAIGAEVVNLGVAGAGKGEHEVSNLLAQIPNACMYIMDWGANMADPKEAPLIRERYPYMIKVIRARYPRVPIIFVMSQSFIMDAQQPTWKEAIGIIRDAIRANYDADKDAGNPCALVDAREFIGPGDMDCTVDGAHCNDLGFDRYVQALLPVVQQFIQKQKKE